MYAYTNNSWCTVVNSHKLFPHPRHPFPVLSLISPSALRPDLSTKHRCASRCSSPLRAGYSTTTHFSIFDFSSSINEPDVVDSAVELHDDLVKGGEVDDGEDGIDGKRGKQCGVLAIYLAVKGGADRLPKEVLVEELGGW